MNTETDYAIAWALYQHSNEFVELIKVLNKAGIHEPYCTNIVRNAFDAGWNAPQKPPAKLEK